MVRFSMYSGECLNEEEGNGIDFDLLVREGNNGFNPLHGHNGFNPLHCHNGFEHRLHEVGFHPRTQALVTHPLRLGRSNKCRIKFNRTLPFNYYIFILQLVKILKNQLCLPKLKLLSPADLFYRSLTKAAHAHTHTRTHTHTHTHTHTLSMQTYTHTLFYLLHT